MWFFFLIAVFSFSVCVHCDNTKTEGIKDNLNNEESRLVYTGDQRYTRNRQLQGYESFRSLRNQDNYGQFSERDPYRNDVYGDSNNEEEMKRMLDKQFRYTGPTANDEPDKLFRPCAFDDMQCIRQFFATNGQCTPTYGPISDPFTVKLSTIYYPSVNLTASIVNYQVRGFSRAKIVEFYVNKNSSNLVLAIEVRNLNITSPRTYFRFRRTAKESIVLSDFATVNYRSIIFTAVIPDVPHMRLEDADIHPYSNDGTPVYQLGPSVYKSTDPDVISAVGQFAVILPIIVREALVFVASTYTGRYIQENICDFGINFLS